MNILVTGCAGFIGSHLTEHFLRNGHTVIGIDNFDEFYSRKIKEKNMNEARLSERFHFYESDIRDESAMLRIFSGHVIDLVVHLAAKAGVRPSIEKPREYYDVNVMGTNVLLEAMRRFAVKKLLFASSSSVYGNNKKIPFSELDVVDFPISPYAATKKACELMCYTYHHLYGIDCYCFRFFTVYGPRQRPEMAISKFTESILKGDAIELFAGGTSSRDYTYIDDIVNGIVAGVEQVKGYQIINLGGASPINLLELVSLIEKISNKKAHFILSPTQGGDVDQTYADLEKARRLLNYRVTVSIEQGLTKYIDWVLKDLGRSN
jgi:UDP-glucuronate 4-epimerase